MAAASQDDVANRLGRPLGGGHETTLVSTLLEDAERILEHGLPGLTDRAEAEDSYRQRVVQVEAAMVARVLRNPSGYRTLPESGSTVDPHAAAGWLRVFSDEWALLGYAGESAVFTIAPAFPNSPWDPDAPYGYWRGEEPGTWIGSL